MLKGIKNTDDYIATLNLVGRLGVASYAVAAAYYGLKNDSSFRINYKKAQRILNKLEEDKLVNMQFANSVKCFALTTKAVKYIQKNHGLKHTINTDSLSTAYHRLLADYTTLSLVKGLQALGLQGLQYHTERQCLIKKGEMRTRYKRRPDGVVHLRGQARSIVIEVEKSRRKDYMGLLNGMRNASGTPELGPALQTEIEASLWVFIVNEDTYADTLRALKNEFNAQPCGCTGQGLNVFSYHTTAYGPAPITSEIISAYSIDRATCFVVLLPYCTKDTYLQQLEKLANPALAQLCADVLTKEKSITK